MHHNSIHTMAIEMYKAVNGISPEIMSEVFNLREETHYNLKNTTRFLVDPIHSVFNGSEWASYLSPKIWEQNPTVIENKDKKLKKDKKWKPLNCLCRIYKRFIANLGFI